MNKLYRILGKRGRITIPFEIRRRVGFAYNDVLSFTENADGRTVVVKREKICDNCKGAPTNAGTDEVTLLDFLNGLSEAEQRAALVHLSIKWAEKQTLDAGKYSQNYSLNLERELGAGTACWAEKQGGNPNAGTQTDL